MAHCLLSLYRLSVLDDPAWDRRAVRNKLDLLQICDQLKLGFEELSAKRRLDSGPTIEEDGFTKFNMMLRTMKSGWVAELAAIDGVDLNGGGHHSSSVDQYLDAGNANELNLPLFHAEDPEAWMAGLFDMNWDP